MDIFQQINKLDSEILKELKNTKLLFLFRIGSSLHKNKFNKESDVDYIAVVESLNINFINNLPNKISPNLTLKTTAENLNFFFWRVDLKPLEEHKVNIIFYTIDKFMSYLEQRSGAKIYLINEHKLLFGDKPLITKFKRLYTPNKETAINDLKVLKDEKYNNGTAKFLWSWRSVALLKSNCSLWLKNKEEIEEYVNKEYTGKIKEKEFLTKELEHLLK